MLVLIYSNLVFSSYLDKTLENIKVNISAKNDPKLRLAVYDLSMPRMVNKNKIKKDEDVVVFKHDNGDYYNMLVQGQKLCYNSDENIILFCGNGGSNYYDLWKPKKAGSEWTIKSNYKQFFSIRRNTCLKKTKSNSYDKDRTYILTPESCNEADDDQLFTIKSKEIDDFDEEKNSNSNSSENNVDAAKVAKNLKGLYDSINMNLKAIQSLNPVYTGPKPIKRETAILKNEKLDDKVLISQTPNGNGGAIKAYKTLEGTKWYNCDPKTMKIECQKPNQEFPSYP